MEKLCTFPLPSACAQQYLLICVEILDLQLRMWFLNLNYCSFKSWLCLRRLCDPGKVAHPSSFWLLICKMRMVMPTYLVAMLMERRESILFKELLR